MIKRVAIFVEGLTEQEFVIRLLSELAGKKNIEFDIYKQSRGYLSWSELRSDAPSPIVHIMIANCSNDEQVKSQIMERYDSLKSAGYSLIIGLRDVYPFCKKEIPCLKKGLLLGLPADKTIPIKIHLAIMEIEAWFIEEKKHFVRIDINITSDKIIANGFDYNEIFAHELPKPAETLGEIYQSVGKGYTKRMRSIQRTIDALSYDELYLETRKKSPSLDEFITSLESVISN